MKTQELEIVEEIPENNLRVELVKDYPDMTEVILRRKKLLKSTEEFDAVTHVEDTGKMAEAKRLRLDLVKCRTSLEAIRKGAGEGYLRKKQAIDSIFNSLKRENELAENFLKEQEEYAIRYEASRKLELKTERDKVLAPYADPALYQTGEMSESQFSDVLAGAKFAHEQRLAAEEAERKRVAEEAQERQRLAEENARLRAQQEEERRVVAQQQEAERRKFAAEAAKAQEDARKKQAALEKQAAEERKQREAVERAEKDRLAAEKKKADDEKKAAAKAARAPDKKKLEVFLQELTVWFEQQTPTLKTGEAVTAFDRFLESVVNAGERLTADLEKL